MTGLLWFLFIAALVTIAGVVWLEHRRHAADEARFEDELDQEFGGHSETTDAPTALLCLPDPDLVGPVIGDADPPGADTGAEADPVRAQGVHGAEADRSGAVAAARLTPAQRRRAVKKGRIPRNLPGPVPADSTAGASWDRAGELDDLTVLAGAPIRGNPSRAGDVHHERHERTPRPLEIYDPLMHGWMPVFPTLLESARHEAHFRQWEAEVGPEIVRAWDDWADGFGRLEQTDWIGAAA